MNRCLNNFFGYCDGIPDIDLGTTSTKYIDLAGKKQIKEKFYKQCRLNHRTCDKFAIQSQLPLTKPISAG